MAQYAAEHGFSAAYCFAPQAQDGAPDWVRAFVLLTRDYAPGGWTVDHFYPTSNSAYHAARILAQRVADETGARAERLDGVRFKPLCLRHPSFGTGRNTLNYRPGIGSRFCMELLGIDREIETEEPAVYDARLLPCGDCDRCARACPTGAITPQGFVKERCIRFHMLSGKPMPEEMRPLIGDSRGVRAIVGCDICQRVCPANQEIEKRRSGEDALSLSQLLRCDADTMEQFAALYGKNYANRNRILAQAVLAAAHTGSPEYTQEIAALRGSPSPLVAGHADWAVQEIEKKNKIY